MRHSSLIRLSHDHHHGLALALRCRKQALGQLKPMGAAGLRQRAAEVLDFYKKNLVSHFRAEEGVLFPLLQASVPQSVGLIDELRLQHGQIRRAMPRLEAGTSLAKLLFDLGDLLEAHIRKEERELFPLFEKHVAPAYAETVGVEIQNMIENREPS